MSAQVTRAALTERMQTTRYQDQSLIELGTLNTRLLRGHPARGQRRFVALTELPTEGMKLLAQAPEGLHAQQNALKAEEGNEEIRMEKLIEEKQKDAAAAQSEIERLSAEYADSQEKCAMLQRDISSMERSKDRDQGVIGASSTETQHRTQGLEAHIEARSGIIANLGTAVGTLQGSGCKAEESLVEISSSLDVQSRSASPATASAAAPPPGVISWDSRPSERSDLPPAFVQTSSAVDVVDAEDPFAGVKAHIQEMISSLKAKINGDMDHADWCVGEKTKNEAEAAAKQVEIDTAQADVREKKMELARVEDQISFASSEVTRLEKSAAEQAESAKLEHTKNAAMLKEHSLAVQCLDQSVDILRKYYDLPAAPAPQSTGEAKTGQSLVDMLLQTKTMTTSLTALVTNDEKELDAFVEKVSKETLELKQLRAKERDDLMASQAEIADGITSGEADFKKLTQELELVGQYTEQLQEECGPQKVDMEERKKRP